MKTVSLISMLILLSSNLLAQRGPKVIFKFDDLGVKNGSCTALNVMNYLIYRDIKASFGVIADRLDHTTTKTMLPLLGQKNKKGESLFEFWHHGLDHKKPEFKNTCYEYQKQHFEKADSIVRKLMGLQMRSFGTPFNSSDEITEKVFMENNEYCVFIFSSIKPNDERGRLFLNNLIKMEIATGVPDFDLMIENYRKLAPQYSDYIILQAHPNGWQDDKIEVLGKIIDFLQGQGCEFVLPYEYYTNYMSKKK